MIVSGPVESPTSESPRPGEFFHYEEVKDHRNFYNPYERSHHVEEDLRFDHSLPRRGEEKFQGGSERSVHLHDPHYHRKFQHDGHFSGEPIASSHRPESPRESQFYYPDSPDRQSSHEPELGGEHLEPVFTEEIHGEDYSDGPAVDHHVEYYEDAVNENFRNAGQHDKHKESEIRVPNQPYLRQTHEAASTQTQSENKPEKLGGIRMNKGSPKNTPNKDLNDHESSSDVKHDQDYYDRLYEEFMEETYDDYYNDQHADVQNDYDNQEHTVSNPADKGKQSLAEKVHPSSSTEIRADEKPKDTVNPKGKDGHVDSSKTTETKTSFDSPIKESTKSVEPELQKNGKDSSTIDLML